MTTTPDVRRWSAFTRDPAGGNPAGVVLAAAEPDTSWMQQVAVDVGYSETAFLWPRDDGSWDVRYFSPVAEVPFCGHATIASGAVLAGEVGAGTHVLHTRGGPVPVEVGTDDDGAWAALTSIAPRSVAAPGPLVVGALGALGWDDDVLDRRHEAAVADAGARHLLLVLATREALAAMSYAFERLRALMVEHDLTTVALLWQQDEATWYARNAFPVGGVVEDPATGAAAAALGGWLRDVGEVRPPADVVVFQGEDLGRPSRLDVHVPQTGGIRVAGRAVPIG